MSMKRSRPCTSRRLLVASSAFVIGAFSPVDSAWSGVPLALTGSLHGQDIVGVVLEQVTQAPVRGAVVSLLLVSDDDADLQTVAVTRTEETGEFAFVAVAPGSYRIQAEAEGLLSSLSDRIVVEAGTDADQGVALLVPSRLMLLAYECQAESGDTSTTVVGFVRDSDGEVGLPGAVMEARWQVGEQTRRVQGRTDGAGRYRLCGIPRDAGFVQLQAQLLGRTGRVDEVEISSVALIFHDVNLGLGPVVRSGGPAIVEGGGIQQQILMEAAARGLGDLAGTLVDQRSGEPVRQAVISVGGTSLQALTGPDGRFHFEGIQPGRYTLDIRHLGYAAKSDPVEVPAGQNVFVNLRVAPQAVVLEEIRVTTRSAVEELARMTPFRRDIVYGQAMAEEESRGARAFETLRRASPGLQVTELFREGAPPMVCIQTNRRIQSLANDGACQMVQVIVDGTRISPDEGSGFLRNLSAAEVESIEFMAPTEAAIRYGSGGAMANGVVVVYTRGKGPYASPLRNRPPGG
ncbi:hypothetical protein BH23GEM11_BH23GEM11_14460 [soil metagenome]